MAVLEKEVESAKAQLADVVVRSRAEIEEEEERRDTMKSMNDEIIAGRKKIDDMQERRK